MPRQEAKEADAREVDPWVAIMRREPDFDELERVVAEYDKDPIAAIPALESLAAQGSIAGMEYLALAYRAKGDKAKEKHWYAAADTAGSPHGALGLASMLENEGDTKSAFEAVKRSSDRGYLLGMYRLGNSYERGAGTARDVAKAKESYERAAKRGHWFAKIAIARLYLRGNFGFFRRIYSVPLGVWYAIGYGIQSSRTDKSQDPRMWQ